jgi:hypothetical protein
MSAPAELKTWLTWQQADEVKTCLTFEKCFDLAVRRYALQWLAERAAREIVPVVTDDALERLLATYAHHTLTAEERNDLFDEHVTALRRLAQLDAGDIGWADVNENLTVPDRTAAAREILDAQAEDAFDGLLNGKKWGTR